MPLMLSVFACVYSCDTRLGVRTILLRGKQANALHRLCVESVLCER